MSRAARSSPAPVLEAMHQFLGWLIPTVEKFPRSQKFLLGDRIQGVALDILERLVEATYDRDRGAALRAANLSVEKLRHLFRVAHGLQHLDMRRYEHASRELDSIGRQIGGWLKAEASRDRLGARRLPAASTTAHGALR